MRCVSLSAKYMLPRPSSAIGPGVAPRPAVAASSTTVGEPPPAIATIPADVVSNKVPSEATAIPPGTPSVGFEFATGADWPPLIRKTNASGPTMYTAPCWSTVSARMSLIGVCPIDTDETIASRPRPLGVVLAVPGKVVFAPDPDVVVGAVVPLVDLSSPPPSVSAAITTTSPTAPPTAPMSMPLLRPLPGELTASGGGTGARAGACQAGAAGATVVAAVVATNVSGVAGMTGCCSELAPANAAPTAIASLG